LTHVKHVTRNHLVAYICEAASDSFPKAYNSRVSRGTESSTQATEGQTIDRLEAGGKEACRLACRLGMHE